MFILLTSIISFSIIMAIFTTSETFRAYFLPLATTIALHRQCSRSRSLRCLLQLSVGRFEFECVYLTVTAASLSFKAISAERMAQCSAIVTNFVPSPRVGVVFDSIVFHTMCQPANSLSHSHVCLGCQWTTLVLPGYPLGQNNDRKEGEERTRHPTDEAATYVPSTACLIAVPVPLSFTQTNRHVSQPFSTPAALFSTDRTVFLTHKIKGRVQPRRKIPFYPLDSRGRPRQTRSLRSARTPKTNHPLTN